MKLQEYDIIVVGAGHAGCEAALTASKMGVKVLLITLDMEKMGQMSCNPAMGGIAKGQILREIDALGGHSAIIADLSSIQFRMLNKSKGPAMWSPRSQCDRIKFSQTWRSVLENASDLDLWQDAVTGLVVENNEVKGVTTRLGVTFRSNAVILTNGTFLNGLMHIGRVQIEGGRISEQPSKGLTSHITSLGIETGRMKTGTPARLDGRTIDFSKLQRQDGDAEQGKFSYLPEIVSPLTQRPCFITFTSPKVHHILERGFVDSPMYNGTIKSIGPRYCPSIEDKIVTFASKEEHHLFLEPEGETSQEYYINGFSSSLPWNIQYEALRQIEGLENVKIFRPGYAIEYDFFQPTQLTHSLESKWVRNLYFAGQVNGTTGYEEAAAQGLMAAINAVLKLRGDPSLILGRDQAYIGVLIDDLVTKGVDEPYRMFTSRAEFRMLLRQDDADVRLTPVGASIGLASERRIQLLEQKIKARDEIIEICRNTSIKTEIINPILQSINSSPIKHPCRLFELILRPEISLTQLSNSSEPLKNYINSIPDRQNEIVEATEISMKYSGYIEREKGIADKIKRLDHIIIKENFDYHKLESLSTEARQKLSKIRPITIGQASRIPGVSPADINILLVRFGR